MLIALLCVAVAALRLGGAHLHICLDGHEPPISLHLADSGIHHIDEPGGGAHADEEIAIGADALIKKPAAGLESVVLALLISWLLLGATPRRAGWHPIAPTPARARARPHLRPPLRGPPLPV